MHAQPILDALQEQLRDLNTRTLEPVEVAILDSGIDSSHPDLAGRVIESYAVKTNGEDESLSVEPTQANTNNDACGHGTGVGSIIARIAPNARLVDVRVLNERNTCTGEALIAALKFAVQRNTRLINMSLAAAERYVPALSAQCERAYQQKQIIVAAAKNLPLPDYGFPAELSTCVSVDNETMPDAYSLCYRFNHVIDFAALGEDVPIAQAGGGYRKATGASFSAPTVTGLIALLLGVYPQLRTFEIKTILKAMAVSHVE